MKRFLTFSFIFLYITSAHSQNLDEGLSRLCEQISSGMTESNRKKIAVIEFSDLDGKITELGEYLAEELITKLFLTKKFNVIERQLLNKVLAEHKLKFTGLIDKNTAKELGKILGADAICSGTITDLVTFIKVNARLIDTETGLIFAVAACEINSDNTVKRMMSVLLPNKEGSFNKEKRSPDNDIFFRDDFSNYEVGDIASDWGKNVVVLRSISGEYFLMNQDNKTQLLTHEINFPKNFLFEFEFLGKTGYKGENLILVDQNNQSLVINILTDTYDDYITLGGIKSRELGGFLNSITDGSGWNTFKLVVKDNVYKAYLNNKFAVSGTFRNYSIFTKIVYTAGSKRCLKNFIGRRIG